MLLPYRSSHLNVCVNIFVAAFSAPPLSYDFITEEKTRRYLKDLARAPGFEGFVYEEGGQAAAFCFGKHDDYFHAPQYEVCELAVLPELHGKGVGRRVMAQLEVRMKKAGIAAIILHTSRTIPAYYFYKKLGYTEVTDNATLTIPL